MSKLPPKNDSARDAAEKRAIETRDKAGQVVDALKEGKLPSTGQITEGIDKIQNSEELHDAGHGMTPLGKRVLADTEKLLESTKRIFEEKNAGNELQNVVYYGTQSAKDINDSTLIPDDFKHKVKTEASSAQREASETVQSAFKKILRIPNLIISNSEFRLLLNEINSIIQDAINVNLPKQNINQHHTSESSGLHQNINQHHTSESSGLDQNKNQQHYTSELSGPDQNINNNQFNYNNNNNNITQETQPQDPNQIKEEIRQTAKGTADRTTQQLRGSAYPIAKSAAKIGGEHIKDFSEGKKSLKDAATDGAKSLQSSIQQNMADYKLSDEQRDRLVNRFKNVMIEAHKNPEYQDAITELMDLVSRLAQQTQQLTQQLSENLTGTQENINNNDAIQVATKNAKNLIENFANNQSLDPLIESLREFGRQMQKDQELRNYFKELQEFIVKSLRDTDFIQNTDFTKHGSQLIKTGRQILLEKYRGQTENIQRQVNSFNTAIQNDQATAQWTKDLDNLITDLFLDEKGRPTIKYELIKDTAKIVPIFTSKLKYLPLPRIENSDDEYDYAFDNMVLHLPEILPKHVHMSLTSDINLDRDTNNVVQNFVFFEISKLRADARNIAFYYKKKKGMLNMNDVGLVDFSIPDNGLKFYIKVLLHTPTEDQSRLRFDVLEADTTIETLKLRLHDTKHDILYKILTPLAQNRIKKQLETTITEKLKAAVQMLQDNLKRLQAQASKIQQNSNINSNISNLTSGITTNIKGLSNKNIIGSATNILTGKNTNNDNDNTLNNNNNNNNNHNNNNNNNNNPEHDQTKGTWQTKKIDPEDNYYNIPINNNNKKVPPSATTPQYQPLEE